MFNQQQARAAAEALLASARTYKRGSTVTAALLVPVNDLNVIGTTYAIGCLVVDEGGALTFRDHLDRPVAPECAHGVELTVREARELLS